MQAERQERRSTRKWIYFVFAMMQKPEEELQAQILQLMGEQQERVDLTKRLQAQVDSLQADHEAIEAENRRLREAVLSRDATLSRSRLRALRAPPTQQSARPRKLPRGQTQTRGARLVQKSREVQPAFNTL